MNDRLIAAPRSKPCCGSEYCFARHRRRAFTLVELLVVIAIIGMLVALLLPAVQAARESARRMQCANNMKQIGLAILNHESAKQQFPPGGWCHASLGAYAEGATGAVVDCEGTDDCTGTGWSIEVLPYMEQQGLYDRYDQEEINYSETDINGNGLINGDLLRTEFPAMRCPTDTNEFDGDVEYARGSYRGVAGIRDERNGTTVSWLLFRRDPRTNSLYHDALDSRGVFHMNGMLPAFKPETMNRVTDGTTKSMVLGENHITQDSDSSGLVYWASSFRFENKAEGHYDPLMRQSNYDLCVENVQSEVVSSTVLCRRLIGSTHPGGGGNWLYLDGSVTFLSTTIDGFVYEAMCTIAGQDEFEPLSSQ